MLLLVRDILYGLGYRDIGIDESFLTTRIQLIHRLIFLTRSIFHLDMDGEMLVPLEV